MILSNGEPTKLKGLALAKYQPLPELLTSILNVCRSSSKLPSARRNVQDKQTEVIGVVSAVGGSGKTTAALNLAKQIGNAGLSVFYLNLEMINSSAIFPRKGRNVEDAQGLPRLLYELKAAQEDKEAEPVSLASFTVHHSDIKADLFECVTNLKELLQLGKSETNELLDCITDSGSYDVVIIDTDSGMNNRTETVIEKSGRLVWVMLDDLINMHKHEEWFSYLERTEPSFFEDIRSKSSFVINRYVGNLVNELPSCISDIDGVLPYIPSWKQNSHEELLLSSPIYQRDIQKLCRHLLGDEFVVRFEVHSYG
ncbi:AAA family ATPase [Paenibacillus pini]|uniref:AAA domain-containing protein n=1 Tax=Paenibacillus pini JCM 16418 TaxID=1236976 RepID=W7YIC9_9BACL|nr:AAA family ATPase [Paenibacillus pini]GAF08202.1 hypothetical protein JCM16418_2243 [Paenibacillus pini JCM 16418]